MTRIALIAVLVLAGCAAGERASTAAPTPDGVVSELLQADRGYASRAATSNVIDGIAELLAPDAWMPAGPTLYNGRDAILEYLRSNPSNLSAHLEWSPVRGGVSADGTHGFTFGFMTLVRPDSPSVAMKYLAYWVKGTDGWKAVAFKRARRAEGDVPTTMMPPALPPGMVAVNENAADVDRLATELGDVERAFSVLAGEIGLGPAFRQNSAPDAMNMGGPNHADFVYGPDSISAVASAGEEGPSKLTWGPDKVIVASSGDLGVSIGHIAVPGEPGAPVRQVPFFTVWRKAGPGEPWKFVAE